jgi:hypothetical protein
MQRESQLWAELQNIKWFFEEQGVSKREWQGKQLDLFKGMP